MESRGGGGFWCGVWCCLQILALLNTLLRCHGKTPYTLTRMEGKENIKRRKTLEVEGTSRKFMNIIIKK